MGRRPYKYFSEEEKLEARRRNKRAQAQRKRQLNRDKGLTGDGEPKRTRKRGLRLGTPQFRLYTSAQKRARENVIPFSIRGEDIVVPEVCPILGIPLFCSKLVSGPNSPSIDRIIPALGYVPGNVQVISNRANAIKSNAELHELVMVGQWALRRIQGI